MSSPKYAYTHAGPPTPLDKIIERKGPYFKFWVGVRVEVLNEITRRDVSHVREQRAVIFKSRDEIPKTLAIRQGKPVWIKSEPVATKFA